MGYTEILIGEWLFVSSGLLLYRLLMFGLSIVNEDIVINSETISDIIDRLLSWKCIKLYIICYLAGFINMVISTSISIIAFTEIQFNVMSIIALNLIYELFILGIQ